MRAAPLLALCAACATVRAPAAPEGGLRLAQDARPTRYAVALTLIPGEPSFDGAVDVALELPTPRAEVVLHATELAISAVRVEAGGATFTSTAHRLDADRVAVALGAARRGAVTVHLEFRGRVLEHDERGVFARRDEDARYLFTQFENTDARRAFPCIDEPGYKVPWSISLRVPEGARAFATTPQLAEEAPDARGLRWLRFAETPPMPSYLVAFAVGPFELVDVGRFGARQTPVRLVIPRGTGGETASARAIAGEALERLERWFGTPYPYAKLDLVAVPELITFGAMENAGLMIFAKAALLAKDAERTPAFERYLSSVVVHELAHQWFGNLVTMAWWDDLWLNEAFASWMEGNILRSWHPEWEWEANTAAETQIAFRGDSLASARTVRQPIESAHDLENAFGTITYLKGQSIVAMFSEWLGEDTFKAGVARYLAAHAWGNATTRDFARALGEVAGRPLDAPLASFLDQQGVPMVRIARRCDARGAAILLEASPLPTLGSPPSAQRRWQLPVALRVPEGRVSTLLESPRAELPLSSCPAWILPNAGGSGYYVAAPSDRALLPPAAALSLAERLMLVRDADALVRAGVLELGAALDEVPALLADPSTHLRRAAIARVRDLARPLVPEALGPRFERYVRDTFGPAARALGFSPRADEGDAVRLLRPELLLLAAEHGADPALLAEAARLTAAWLDDPTALTEDVVDIALLVTAQRGDRALFARLRAEAKATADDRRRGHLLAAMSAFRDPAIVRESMAIFLSDEHDPNDAVVLLYQDPRMAEVALDFVRERFDAIVERMPSEARASLLSLTDSFCDARQRALAEAVFAPKQELIGGPRPLAEALESIDQCIALRAAQLPSLERRLR